MEGQPLGLGYRSPEWVAEQLDIDRTTVYRYLREGTLPALQLGKKWLISEEALRKFLKDEQSKQTNERQLITWVTNWANNMGWPLEEEDGERLVSEIHWAAGKLWPLEEEPPPYQVVNYLRRGEIRVKTDCPGCHGTYANVVYRSGMEWLPTSFCLDCRDLWETSASKPSASADGRKEVTEDAKKIDDL